jgi:hypothetical protein
MDYMDYFDVVGGGLCFFLVLQTTKIIPSLGNGELLVEIF